MTDLKIKILQFLNQNQEGTSGDKIAEQCGVSLNTVRKEIGELRGIIGAEGMDIKARPSYGYCLVIQDKTKAEHFFEVMVARINNPLFGKQTSQDYNVNYIVRRLLLAKDYVSLPILADELFYSVSSVRRELWKVDKFLQDYNLSLQLKKNYGYAIQGTEWAKRVCLMAQHKLFVNLSSEQQKFEPAMLQLFGTGDEKVRKYRHQVARAIEVSNMLSFKMIDFPILTYYIPLIPNRKRYSKEITADAEQKELLACSGMLQEAERILSVVEKELPIDEEEILAYAMLLQVFRNVTDPTQLESAEFEVLKGESMEIFHSLAQKNSFLERASASDMTNFMCCWYGIRNKILFRIIPDEENMRGVENPEPFVEDVCIEMAKYLEEEYDCPISNRQVLSIYYVFLMIYLRRMENIYRYNALVVSTYGYQYANFAAQLIRKNYSIFFKNAKAIEFTQLKQDTMNKYNMIITDLRPEIVEQNVPCMGKLKLIRMENVGADQKNLPALDEYLDEIIENGKRSLLSEKNILAKDIDDLIETIVADMALPDSNQLKNNLTRRLYYDAMQLREDTLFLTAQVQLSDVGICLYHNEKNIVWKEHKIKHVICCLYHDRDFGSLYLMELLLKELR